MRGFPNQVADLKKLEVGVQCLIELADRGDNPKDDGVFGPGLVRAGVAGTGHAPRPVEDYIREQLLNPPAGQSFRTTARGLRQLYRLLGFIDDSHPAVLVTELGRRAGALAPTALDDRHVDFWRRVIRNMTLEDADGTSHPYEVLLRLVARKPGITRAKCALALEAKNDSAEELDRIVALAELDEDEIRERIGVTESNWDNAKKVLPAFAEQLGDVAKTGQSYVIADAPGTAAATPGRVRPLAGARAPRTSRRVTPDTIARAGTGNQFDEVESVISPDPEVAARAAALRLDRLRRHNLMVQGLAVRLRDAGAQLYEDPFDILAIVDPGAILIEVKTLDGTEGDERDRVRDALSQLLYYEAFLTPQVAGNVPIRKVACFEAPISQGHRDWLNRSGIAAVWMIADGLAGDDLARDFLGPDVGQPA